ncbi:MAG: SRPBCC family protein [Methylocella sp.]
MPGFSAQISINAPARRVFDFVSKIENLPRYLPTVEKVGRVDDDHVYLQGALRGVPYAFAGAFSVDEDALQISWGSNESNNYHGEFQAFDTDEGSELACRIEFDPNFESMRRLAGADGVGEAFIEAKLNAVLQNIKTEIESSPQDGATDEADLANGKKADYKLPL